jgi:hypothetical protein
MSIVVYQPGYGCGKRVGEVLASVVAVRLHG